MSGFWRRQFLLLILLSFVVLSEGSRLPKDYWEQMLPKKLPSPSSSPSKGTNSVFATSSTTLKTDSLPSSDGKESDVKWASRWDTYLLMNDDQIHWFSIVNSLMIVLFLSGMVAMIMLQTLYRDIAKYNELETQEEAQEETGWKLVHGDVFRPPNNSNLLCVYVGTGVQFFGMILVTMIFAMLGFLSPSNRGGLMTAMLLLWVFMGIFAGYSSTRLYKVFKGSEWKKIALRTATLFPAVVSVIFFILNALIWGQKSSGAVPFCTMFALIFLWFGISVPLVFVGSYIGFRKPAIETDIMLACISS